MRPLILFCALLAYARAAKRSLSETVGAGTQAEPRRTRSTGALVGPDLGLKKALTEVTCKEMELRRHLHADKLNTKRGNGLFNNFLIAAFGKGCKQSGWRVAGKTMSLVEAKPAQELLPGGVAEAHDQVNQIIMDSIAELTGVGKEPTFGALSGITDETDIQLKGPDFASQTAYMPVSELVKRKDEHPKEWSIYSVLFAKLRNHNAKEAGTIIRRLLDEGQPLDIGMLVSLNDKKIIEHLGSATSGSAVVSNSDGRDTAPSVPPSLPALAGSEIAAMKVREEAPFLLKQVLQNFPADQFERICKIEDLKTPKQKYACSQAIRMWQNKTSPLYSQANRLLLESLLRIGDLTNPFLLPREDLSFILESIEDVAVKEGEAAKIEAAKKTMEILKRGVALFGEMLASDISSLYLSILSEETLMAWDEPNSMPVVNAMASAKIVRANLETRVSIIDAHLVNKSKEELLDELDNLVSKRFFSPEHSHYLREHRLMIAKMFEAAVTLLTQGEEEHMDLHHFFRDDVSEEEFSTSVDEILKNIREPAARRALMLEIVRNQITPKEKRAKVLLEILKNPAPMGVEPVSLEWFSPVPEGGKMFYHDVCQVPEKFREILQKIESLGSTEFWSDFASRALADYFGESEFKAREAYKKHIEENSKDNVSFGEFIVRPENSKLAMHRVNTKDYEDVMDDLACKVALDLTRLWRGEGSIIFASMCEKVYQRAASVKDKSTVRPKFVSDVKIIRSQVWPQVFATANEERLKEAVAACPVDVVKALTNLPPQRRIWRNYADLLRIPKPIDGRLLLVEDDVLREKRKEVFAYATEKSDAYTPSMVLAALNMDKPRYLNNTDYLAKIITALNSVTKSLENPLVQVESVQELRKRILEIAIPEKVTAAPEGRSPEKKGSQDLERRGRDSERRDQGSKRRRSWSPEGKRSEAPKETVQPAPTIKTPLELLRGSTATWLSGKKIDRGPDTSKLLTSLSITLLEEMMSTKEKVDMREANKFMAGGIHMALERHWKWYLEQVDKLAPLDAKNSLKDVFSVITDSETWKAIRKKIWALDDGETKFEWILEQVGSELPDAALIGLCSLVAEDAVRPKTEEMRCLTTSPFGKAIRQLMLLGGDTPKVCHNYKYQALRDLAVDCRVATEKDKLLDNLVPWESYIEKWSRHNKRTMYAAFYVVFSTKPKPPQEVEDGKEEVIEEEQPEFIEAPERFIFDSLKKALDPFAPLPEYTTGTEKDFSVALGKLCDEIFADPKDKQHRLLDPENREIIQLAKAYNATVHGKILSHEFNLLEGMASILGRVASAEKLERIIARLPEQLQYADKEKTFLALRTAVLSKDTKPMGGAILVGEDAVGGIDGVKIGGGPPPPPAPKFGGGPPPPPAPTFRGGPPPPPAPKLGGGPLAPLPPPAPKLKDGSSALPPPPVKELEGKP